MKMDEEEVFKNSVDSTSSVITINVKNFYNDDLTDFIQYIESVLIDRSINFVYLDFNGTESMLDSKFFDTLMDRLYSKYLKAYLDVKLRMISLKFENDSRWIIASRKALSIYQPWEINVSLYSMIYGKRYHM